MGYRLDEPFLIAVSKPLLTEFGIHQRLESCGDHKGFFPCSNFYEGFMSGCVVPFLFDGISEQWRALLIR